MSRLQYLTEKGQFEEVHGSDTRLNVSSRSNSRAFYISRDNGQFYSIVSHDPTVAAGTHPIYLQNTSSSLKLYVDKVFLGGIASILWKIWFVTGTAGGGNVLTATNYNKTSSKAASVTARGDDAITSFTQDTEILTLRTAANEHSDETFDGTIILGQNDAIAIEADAVTSTDIGDLVIEFHLE